MLRNRVLVLVAMLVPLALCACADRAAGAAVTQAGFPAITDQMLVDAGTSDGSLMYLRSYSGENHVPFTQIDTGNVAQLREVFTHAVSIPEGFESPPMVNGRTMIVTTPLDRVYALDAVTGRQALGVRLSAGEAPAAHRLLRYGQPRRRALRHDGVHGDAR
jgi:glucose dehydrogenase